MMLMRLGICRLNRMTMSLLNKGRMIIMSKAHNDTTVVGLKFVGSISGCDPESSKAHDSVIKQKRSAIDELVPARVMTSEISSKKDVFLIGIIC